MNELGEIVRAESGAEVRRMPRVGKVFNFQEPCGFAHDKQVVRLCWPEPLPNLPEVFGLQDKISGEIFPAQRTRRNADELFVQMALRPGQRIALSPVEEHPKADRPVSVESGRETIEIGPEGLWRLRLAWGSGTDAKGPFRGVCRAGADWKGGTFFDTRRPEGAWKAEFLEHGPVRTVYRYEMRWAGGEIYRARITVDAGQIFAAVEEEFSTEPGDQLVWDFSGSAFPEALFTLDPGPGGNVLPLPGMFDQCHARLACWTQYSQLFNLSDGYALCFPEGDVLGFVTLHGGSWSGNRLNFLEAWTRRWWDDDPRTRRLEPPESKADAGLSSEFVPLRERNRARPHFQVEGWISSGRRAFALVPAARDELSAADGRPGLLRKIHTRFGTLGLESMMRETWNWRQPEYAGPRVATVCRFQATSLCELDAWTEQFAGGYWNGAGCSAVNVVAGRDIVPAMLGWEALRGTADPEILDRIRSRLLLLTLLYASEDFYPANATMPAPSDPRSVEPSLAGMANQNFLTDAVNVVGMASRVFSGHPQATEWHQRFASIWRRQLEFHVYPESGVWEESHTYFLHVLLTLLPTFERWRNDGADDPFAEPLFLGCISTIPRQLTPRNAFAGGRRHLVPLGDHEMGPGPLAEVCQRLAANLGREASGLAETFRWVAAEASGSSSPPEAAPVPKSEALAGLGFFLRGKSESLLTLRSGSAWAHHHCDETSLQFYARGTVWIAEAAFGDPAGKYKCEARAHSRWIPADAEPLNFFWRFNRGGIIASRTSGEFPYAVAFDPILMDHLGDHNHRLRQVPILHFRAVIGLWDEGCLVADWTWRSPALSVEIPFHIPIAVPAAVGDERSDAPLRLRLLPFPGLVCQKESVVRVSRKSPELATRSHTFHGLNREMNVIAFGLEEDGDRLQFGEAGRLHFRQNEWTITRQDTRLHVERDGRSLLLDGEELGATAWLRLRES